LNESDSTSGGGVVDVVTFVEVGALEAPEASLVFVVVIDVEGRELSSIEQVDEAREIPSLICEEGSSASNEEVGGRVGATVARGALLPQPISFHS